MRCYEIKVKGHVQGVGFRMLTQKKSTTVKFIRLG